LADFYSQIVDYDDWMLNPMVFTWLDSLWGPHTIDQAQLIDLQALGRLKLIGSTPSFGLLARKLLMLSPVIGWRTIIGGQFI